MISNLRLVKESEQDSDTAVVTIVLEVADNRASRAQLSVDNGRTT